MRTSIISLLLLTFALIAGCSDNDSNPIDPHGHSGDTTATIALRFVPKFGEQRLLLDKKYLNAGGDSVQFTAIRFYLSEVALIDSLGASIPATGIMLIDLGDPAVAEHGYAEVKLRGAPGTYRGLSFSIGVPTADNHKDAATQSLPLGPNSGMYWGWNPGYIFHMIEGKADSASGSVNFGYHIGEDNHKVTVMLATLTGPAATTFTVNATGENIFTVDADYSKLFAVGLDGVTPMKLSTNAAERVHHMSPKNLVDRTTANTRTMFSRGN